MENASVFVESVANSTDYNVPDSSTDPLPDWVYTLENSYLVIISLIGIPGNTMIILIQMQNRDRSSTDYMIATMAVHELGCATFNSFTKILMNLKVWVYVASTTFCRIHMCMTYITQFASAYLLAAISLDRYFKTCKPLRNIFTTKLSKTVSVTSSFVSFIDGLSVLFTFELNDQYFCVISEKYQTLQLRWDMFVISSTVLVFVIFIFAYVNIAITLHQRVKRRKKGTIITDSSAATKNSQSEHGTSSFILKAFGNSKVQPQPDIKSTYAASQAENSKPSAAEVTLSKTDSNQTTNRASCSGERSQQVRINSEQQNIARQRAVNRTTLIMFLLTVIYAITYTTVNTCVLTSNRILGSVMEKLCKSVLMFNCITNPVLFFCLSSKYRTSARAILCRTRPSS